MVNPQEKVIRIIKDEIYTLYLNAPKPTYEDWKKANKNILQKYIERRTAELETNNEVY